MVNNWPGVVQLLKQRVITALVLGFGFLGALLGLPPLWFSALIGVVVLIGAWEWADLAGLGIRWQRLLYTLATAGLLLAGAFYLGLSPGSADLAQLDSGRVRQLLVVAGVWWALALLWVQSYPQSALLWRYRPVRAMMGWLVVVPTWVALTFVRAQDNGIWLVLMTVAVVASADIGGYFAGRRWGRRKLAPNVSPGKTWEGFVGGLACNLLLALVIWLVVGGSYGLLLALVLPACLASVLGDLLESMVKRERGVKDSGTLLPGHGGLLDRVDSLTAAAPVFALALLASGWMPG